MPPKKTAKKKSAPKKVTALTHAEDKRKNIPNAEHQSVLTEEDREVKMLRYPRNVDLDPQLVWRGKDQQDAVDLHVPAPPIYIQEKVHPKALIDDIRRQSVLVASGQCLVDSGKTSHQSLSTDHSEQVEFDLFSDFNGIPKGVDKTEFYQHDQNWSNRMILGDSLQVMGSLAEREGLRGKVQCIYLDPPYGIKFNSNFQWSTTSRDVKDGNKDHITREPEMVKAFRDTWRDGIHSYLTYLRDRLTVARDLLTDSGSIFIQIGDENVHRVRCLMDEVFGEENFISLISYPTSIGLGSQFVDNVNNFIIWYSRNAEGAKFRRLYQKLVMGEEGATRYTKIRTPDGSDIGINDLTITELQRLLNEGGKHFTDQGLTSRSASATTLFPLNYKGNTYKPKSGGWRTSEKGMASVLRANRAMKTSNSIRFQKNFDDFGALTLTNNWTDVGGGVQSRNDPKVYVVQTSTSVIQRCILMATDPGDLVLDPTCGSGTTATVAEQWGRRWITIDTSRVALALARARIMGARYPYYLLADSKEGQEKEAALTRRTPSTQPTYGNIRHGFVYERVPHITLKSIVNNAEIDIIWENFEEQLAPLRSELTQHLPKNWLADYRSAQSYDVEVPAEIQEWEVPRHPETAWPEECVKAFDSIQKQLVKDKPNQALVIRQLKLINDTLDRNYSLSTDHNPLPLRPADPWKHKTLIELHKQFWELRIARQGEIDASIAAKADHEYLYDKPYENKKAVRVAGPFTVESLSPHRTLALDEDDQFIEPTKVKENAAEYAGQSYENIILENLKTAGVQQAHKEDRITFETLKPWPGTQICAEGFYIVNSEEGVVDSGKKSLAPKTIRAGIVIGPEFGSLRREDLAEAAREAGDAGFDVVIATAFSYDAHATEFDKLGRIRVLKARMNADLHMAGDLKNTNTANLFVIFGEPDIVVASEEWLVDSLDQPIAPYEIVKLLSGTRSLAEIHGLEREDLSRYTNLSQRREIWDYLADAAGKLLDPRQYCRGSGPQYDGGVSPVAWDCARLPGGVGDFCDALRKAGIPQSKGFQELIDGLRGSGKNAQRTHQVPAPENLATTYYSQVTIKGIDVFDPKKGEVRSDNTDGIACWMIDTDYNGESFFVRHAYFLGQNDPYKSLKTTLKAEINKEAWDSLNSATSRPFEKPTTGRIAVKAINHLGDEVMKVFRLKD